MQIIFAGYINADDTCTINQGNGKLFVFLRGAADLKDVKSNNLETAHGGLVVPTGVITNGKALIYIK